MKQVELFHLSSQTGFEKLLESRTPAIIRGLDFGPCRDVWTTKYLQDKVGPNRRIVVHSSQTQHMDFETKNFSYETMPFGEFMERADCSDRLYLRAVSSKNPSRTPANLREDFPTIASDFRIPEPLSLVQTREHSSVLRIAGAVTLWLHYDVMANILCLVRGQKRLILFPPDDVHHLTFPPGGSTSGLQLFSADANVLDRTHPYEAAMEPGDILLIPACWPHAAEASTNEGSSVAVNVFFKDLESGYAAGKDVYGNRDLLAYENSRRYVERIRRELQHLAPDERKHVAGDLISWLRDSKLRDRSASDGRGRQDNCRREISKIEKAVRDLPTDLKRFYLDRVENELAAL